MHLYLSSNDHLNSTYSVEDGHVIYRVVTPSTLNMAGAPTSTIDRAIPNVNRDEPGPDSFGFLAAIEHHQISPSRIRYNGEEISVNDFFSKGKMGFSDLGRRRIFSGPDGKEYYWRFGNKSELFLNDGTKTLIAKSHRKHYGIFSDKKLGSLEILPAGEHMMDLILITFIYIEKMRADTEIAVATANS